MWAKPCSVTARCTMTMPIQIEQYRTTPCRLGKMPEDWDAIVPGREELWGTGQRDWDVPGIRAWLESEQALLVVDDEDPANFMIVRVDEAFHNPRQMEWFIYLAFSKSGDAAARLLPGLEEIAEKA